jgi:hypothetical protein
MPRIDRRWEAWPIVADIVTFERDLPALSHRAGLSRLRDMSPKQRFTLAAIVMLHLIVSVVHGSAHTGAMVEQGPAATSFIVVVILAGPLVGLVWLWMNPRIGAPVIAVTMAASLLFGVINHFIIPGADRVDHVAMAWRGLFGSTAVFLAMTEAAGAALGFAYGRRVVRRLA